MEEGKFEVVAYSDNYLRAKLGASNAVDYLCDYLRAINVKSAVLEGRYVDRHYLSDFSAYYSRSFSAPSTHCQRLHFFGATPDAISATFASAYSDEDCRYGAEQSLNDDYLGFIVVRPLAGARVGRTVLRTYPNDGFRRFHVVRPYHVNLGGLELIVEGLAYQQQDGGAAVCASTALWSALQRVAYVAGHRTPTPSAITAASRSPFPASAGLSEIEMAAALSSLGYVADQFIPADNREIFRAKLVATLESQLPVVLSMEKELATGAGRVLTGHAVTVTGYRDGSIFSLVPSPNPNSSPIPMRSAGVSVLYVHDDNLGSHAHYELFDSEELDDNRCKKLKLRRGRSDRKSAPWWEADEWTVVSALVPKPEKMRMPIDSLFLDLIEIQTLASQIFEGVDELQFSTRICTGISYKRGLFDKSLPARSLAAFQQETTFPRYVGLVEVHNASEPLCDFILDVSEVPRNPQLPSVLAIVAPGIPSGSIAYASLGTVAKIFKCTLLSA